MSEESTAPEDKRIYEASQALRGASLNSVRELIAQLAPTDVPILIAGETGTGKEVCAQLVHQYSLRVDKQFIPVNCAAITETIAEAEFFGHEKGSFTGATSQRLGLFEQANRGTIFLDEITEMRSDIQAKVLKALDTNRIRRVGSSTEVKVDVRVISATNRDISEALERGTLREDLYYRLKVGCIHLPPLRERGDDIYELAQFFLDISKSAYRKSMPRIVLGNSALQLLKEYHWPGNVRELKSAIDIAVICSNGKEVLEREDIEQCMHSFQNGQSSQQYMRALESMVRGGIQLHELLSLFCEAAVRVSGGNKSDAAKIIGTNRNTLYNYLRYKSRHE